MALANDASRAADVPDLCTPEQLDNLLKAVDPKALMYLSRRRKKAVQPR